MSEGLGGMFPMWSSWPSLRHAAGEQVQPLQVQHADQQSLLTYEQLRTWLCALNRNDNGHLIISSDSLRLLPAQLPYELLGPLILAAVDGLIANKHQQTRHANHELNRAVDRKPALQDNKGPAAQDNNADQQQQQQQQQQGLQLVGIDLQQPVAAPLTTCMAAYSCLQQLVLQELNIDVCAAKALGGILHSGSSTFTSKGCDTGAAGCSLRSLTLEAVFMCDMAWQALCGGLAAGCELQTIRMLKCLQPTSLPALAAALAGGCQQLIELDVSYNSLGGMQATSSITEAHNSSSSSRSSSSSSELSTIADQAWSSLLEALQGCTQLQVLSAVRSSLGPKAGSAVAKLLRGNKCSLRRLNLAHCGKMGADALNQVATAAACCCSLEQLDLSSTGLSDAALAPLSQGSGSSWLSRGRTAGANELQRLAVGGNCWLSGAAVGQLGRAVAAGGRLCKVTHLSLAGCAGVGDGGAASLAAALAGGGSSLHSLDMSGCELTDAAAAALAGLLTAAPAAEAPAAAAEGGFFSPLKWRAAAAAAVPAGKQVQLLELRLADNQITSAGIHVLAKAVSSQSYRLQLLDVSFNWVGPQGMQPLVEAAAGETAPAGNSTEHSAPQQQIIRVLRECLPEYWRVEAAKQAATRSLAAHADGDAVAAATVHGSGHCSSSKAVSAVSPAGISSCSGSCCSQAGTAGDKALSDGMHTSECIAAEAEQSVTPSNKQLWMFNTLFSHEGSSTCASSAIATGVNDGSDDICNHYDDSDDELSAIDSSVCGTDAARGSSSNDGTPAQLGNDSSNAAVVGAGTGASMLGSTGSHVPSEDSCQVLTSASASFSTANCAEAIGGESSSASMADAPAVLPGHTKQITTLGFLPTTVSAGPGVGSPKKDQARASSTGGAASSAAAAAQPAAGAAVAGAATTKLAPRPPDLGISSRQGSSSSNGSAAVPGWPGAFIAATTPGVKTVRALRRRVSEPTAVGYLSTSATNAGSRSPARATDHAAASAVTSAAGKLPTHRPRAVGVAAEGSASGSLKQHLTAAASSSSLGFDRSMLSCGVSGSSYGSGHIASPAAGVSSDSCALRDCAPMPGRRSALPRVSS